MEKGQIAVYAAVFVVLAVRVYQKYMKKKNPGEGYTHKKSSESTLGSTSDDYEPYSKK